LKLAALRLVRDKGHREFSLNEASRLAGVSVGAPYRHFADKDALLAEIACDGSDLMIRVLEHAAKEAATVREKLVAVGMEYLRFAEAHADYFAVIFKAGLDKSKYPEVERKGKEAFAVILRLAQEFERTPALAAQRAVSCWALVHGLATLSADGALGTAVEHGDQAAYARALLERFLNQPFR
jgi:AcrR family transcriptional regulator